MRWFRKRQPEPPPSPFAARSGVVLRHSVRVADVLAYPNGGPLTVLPRGLPIESIEEQFLGQLCEKHFTSPKTTNG